MIFKIKMNQDLTKLRLNYVPYKVRNEISTETEGFLLRTGLFRTG